MDKYFFTLAKEHKFLFVANAISILICFVSILISVFNDIPLNIIYIIFPVLLIISITFFALNLFKKSPITVKIVTSILNTIFIIIQLIMCFLSFYLLAFKIASTPIENTEHYEKALSSISWQEGVQHFPKNIPLNAKNIIFYKSTQPIFGSEEMTLKFTIDKTYIDNELKKHKYIHTEEPGSEDFYHKDLYNKYDNFTLYVIDNSKNDTTAHRYYYGIGINQDLNQVLYFYSNPD